MFFLRGEFFFLYIREQGNFSRWIVKNWTLCVQFFENAISVFCFSFGSIYWYINFVIFEMENSNFFEREFCLMNELWILRVHLMRLKNENENLQESKKTKIRTLVNLVASESFAHYANETFQVHFFFLCIYIILDICTRTGLYIISSIFLFFFLSYFFFFFTNSPCLILSQILLYESNYKWSREKKTERGTSSIKTTNYRYNEAKQDCPVSNKTRQYLSSN